jgi:small-conductance mechanosensitive channel
LSEIANFSAFALFGTIFSFVLLLIMEVKLLTNSAEENKELYNIDPVSINTNFFYVNWAGIIPYLTIYSGLWENTTSILLFYAEYESPCTFMKNYFRITTGVVMCIFILSALGYSTFG